MADKFRPLNRRQAARQSAKYGLYLELAYLVTYPENPTPDSTLMLNP